MGTARTRADSELPFDSERLAHERGCALHVRFRREADAVDVPAGSQRPAAELHLGCPVRLRRARGTEDSAGAGQGPGDSLAIDLGRALHAEDPGAEEGALVGADLEAPRATARRHRAAAREDRAGAADTAPTGLRECALDCAVRGSGGAVRSDERGLPSVEDRLVDQAEEEQGPDAGIAGEVADQAAVDLRL